MIKGETKKQSIRRTWTISEYRFVGYIDIMGFKNLVFRNTHERIYDMMKKVSEAMNETESTFSTDLIDGEDVYITMTTYSDSMMIYSKDKSPASLLSFLGAVANLSEKLFLAEIPFKGAVAYGQMTLDLKNSIFFGRPLIDAYLLSEELSYYGIVVHASAETRKGFKSSDLVAEYLCPFKTGNSIHQTIVPSTDLANQYDKVEESIKRMRSKTSGGLRKYIDNTLNYLAQISSEKGKKTD